MRLCDFQQKEVINACDCRIVPRGGLLCGWFGDDGEYVIPFDCIRKIGPDIILVEIHEEKRRRPK